MELPRRRTGSYEPRSAVGNVLAPLSGPQGSAELRTTPSTRGGSAAAVATSRPPWATELDAADAPPPQQPPQKQQQQQKATGRTPSTSRAQPRQADRDPHGFNFHTPAPAAGAGAPHHPPSNSPSAPSRTAAAPVSGRLQSGGRGAAPADQLDLWSRQQQQQTQGQGQQGRHSDGLHARADHPESPGAPGPGSVARRASGSGDGPRLLPPGNLGYGDGAPTAAAARSSSGVGAGRGGAVTAAAAARVGASPARAAPAAARSTSNPKPRPAVPPKRSTSITDNVRRDWVDTGAAERKAGGGGGAAAGRWDAEPNVDDRGSWLYAGDSEPPPNSKPPPARGRDPDPDPGQRPPLDRRRQLERPASAGRRASDGHDMDAGGGGGFASPGGGQEWQPPAAPPPRRPRPQSPVSGELEATLSLGRLAAAAPPPPPSAVVLGGGGGTSGMSLGHGPSAGLAMGGGGSGAGRGSGSGGGRQAISAAHAESARQAQALQEENTRLRDQVQHLEQLLAVATPAAATAAAAGGRRGPGMGTGTAAAGGRPWSAGNADTTPSIAAAAASGVVLQQYKSQVIQLQRQVALMSLELEARARMSFEAEGALLEVASKLAELAASSGGGGSGGVSLALPGAAAEAAAGLGAGSGAGGAGGEALSRDRLLGLHKWSKQMLGRLRSEKSESSKLFTQQASNLPGDHRGGSRMGPTSPWSDRGGGGGGSFATGGDGASYAPTWLVPFLPAGGNRFLMAGGDAAAAAAAADDLAGAAGGGGGGGAAGGGAYGTSLAAIAGGQAALLADPLLSHRLELQLAAVAPRLAALAVLLKTQLLPAMPWLGLEAADRLQAEVGEAAESVAQCVEGLVQLCSLLPAGAAVFGEGPVAQEPKRRAAEVDAGRDAWLYGSPELVDAPEPPAVNDEGVISMPRLQAAIAPLLRDRKAGSKALADILEPVRSRSQSAAAKRAVLETELRFAARASALHAEHVSHLMLSVGMALEEVRGAKDAAAIKSYFAAAAAVRQVLEAADALEVHPCETCLKALVEVIRVHREMLGRLPELLVNAPAADVEGRLLGKVEELHQGFRKAVSRLEAHKRRQMDAGGGGAAAAQGDDSDYDEDDDEQDDDEGPGQDGGGGRSARGPAGSTPPRRTPLSSTSAMQQQQQQAAVKPGKPPRPRQEWQE